MSWVAASITHVCVDLVGLFNLKYTLTMFAELVGLIGPETMRQSTIRDVHEVPSFFYLKYNKCPPRLRTTFNLTRGTVVPK